MRDTDQDLTSVVLVRADSDITEVSQLAGRTVGTGAIDSPQATLLPLAHLAGLGLDPGTSFSVRRFDVMVTKHGDHVGGERDAVKALVDGDVDAACVIDGNQLLFAKEGTIADRRGAGPEPHRAVRPLHDDRARRRRRRRRRPVRRAAAVDVVRRPGGPSAARARRPAAVATRPHARATTSSKRAVDRLGFYGADGSILVDGYPP